MIGRIGPLLDTARVVPDTSEDRHGQFSCWLTRLYRSADRASPRTRGGVVLSLTLSSDGPLTDQIVTGIKRQIDDRLLRPGTRLPSIRGLAESHKVSRFTVVEAYDRLVAMGYLHSRRGAGFYTAAARSEPLQPAASRDHKRNEELVWLIRRLLEAGEDTILAGGPWLPNSWLAEAGIRQSLNALARKNGAYLLEYGNPFGYLPLREHLVLLQR